MKTRYIILTILVLFLLGGCSDFLDVVPKGQGTLGSLDELESLLNDEYGGGWGVDKDLPYIINEICPPQGAAHYIAQGSGLTYGYMTYDETVDREGLTTGSSLYSSTYEKILTYNVLLSKIGEVSGDADRKRQLVAEAKTLRAWCHWILVNVFAKAYTPEEGERTGGIPYVEDVNFDEKNIKLTLAEVYGKLLEDLADENLASLPDEPRNVQRPSKAFGYAVKAKVLLSMRDYPKALAYAEKSLALNDHVEDRRAFIGSTPVRGKDAAGNLLYAPGSVNRPNREILSPECAALYEEGDIMRYFTDLYVETEVATHGFAGGYVWENGEDYFYNSSGIRVEDMVLVKAECQARGNDVEGAMKTLNGLRLLRIHPDYYAELTASNAVEAVRHIMRVSRIEYLFTYNNFFNLKRWNTETDFRQNITREVDGRTYTLTPESPYWVLPFPTNATLYNPSLTQNF